jgi:L-rhamnose mutarotase
MNYIVKPILLILIATFTVACSVPVKNENTESVAIEEKEIKQVKRFGSVIKIKPEMIAQYKELHTNPWPEVQEQISKSNIRNYSIYLKDDYLFGYFEYVGDDFEGDMKKMAEDSVTQGWWKMTDPCQIPLETRKEGEWWANMEEVFHQD